MGFYGLVSHEQTGGGIGGGIGQASGGQSYVTVYVQVKDPQTYLDKVVANGGKVVMPVTEIPNMVTFALFNDPEGHLVGLVKEQ
jgi:predicted enzyme related to lactoylglutathione lyase